MQRVTLAITFIVGIAAVLAAPFGQSQAVKAMDQWYVVSVAFAVGLGAISQVSHHVRVIRGRRANWQYSIVLLAALDAMEDLGQGWRRVLPACSTASPWGDGFLIACLLYRFGGLPRIQGAQRRRRDPADNWCHRNARQGPCGLISCSSPRDRAVDSG